MLEMGRDIKIDWRFIEVYYEINSLGTFLEIMEKQIKYLTEQERSVAYAYIKTQQDEVEEVIAHKELREMVDNVLPRYFRNPLLVSIWAVFESTAKDIAKYLKNKSGLVKEFKKVEGDNILAKLQTYYTHDLKIQLYKPNIYIKLNNIRIMRDCIAHSNGRLDDMPNEKRIQIEKRINDNIGVDAYYNNVIISEYYLNDAYSITRNCLIELVRRVQDKYPNGTDTFPVP
jgi:hypothetical protein